MNLNVPYFSQRDNKIEWWRTCNISSHAMCVKYLAPELIKGDDHYAELLEAYGDTTSHEAHTQLLDLMGLCSEWRYDLGYEDLDTQLEKGFPIPIGVLHRGTLANPSGGHVCVVVGKYDEGYIVHDPWGKGFSYYRLNGKNCYYPRQSLDARWIPEGDNSGWGRLFK